MPRSLLGGHRRNINLLCWFKECAATLAARDRLCRVHCWYHVVVSVVLGKAMASFFLKLTVYSSTSGRRWGFSSPVVG